ncbi:TPA: phosphonate ABC transporter, permease protein PhnE [Bacillus cereus]
MQAIDKKRTTIGKIFKSNIKILMYTLLFMVVIYWSAVGVKFNAVELMEGLPNMWNIISSMFPPSLANFEQYFSSMLITIQMSITGTLIAIILSVPLGVGAAENMSPHPLIYQTSRFILNVIRSIPELIVALVFVAAVGLGPFAGVMAMAIHSAGMLGKFYAEAIENISKGEIEALQAAGANKMQILRFAVWPQILPEFIGVSLYRWEINVRAATVLGLVGAGGIGFDLLSTQRLFKYEETATIIILILLTVVIMDRVCAIIRSRII